MAASPSSPSSSLGVSEDAAEQRAQRLRRRKAQETMPVAALGSIVMACAVYVVLQPRVAPPLLVGWLMLRLLVSLARVGYALAYERWGWPLDWHRPLFRIGVFLDALAWSALGWGLTPLDNLEVAIVSLGVLLCVVALGGTMLYMDLVAARLFIATILVPNAFYAAQRGDDLGIFCGVALLSAVAMFMAEARRHHRHIHELQALRDQANQTVRAQAAALDEARSLSETKSRFVATMSHEMRTPVHGILGLARMLRTRVTDAEAQRQVELIRRSGEHLEGIINEVLDYARIEAGSLPLHDQPFDLHEFIHEIADTWSANCQDKGLAWSMVHDILPGETVMGDPQRLRQVLVNLIGNALKFTARGGLTLSVQRREQGAWVDFSVRDTGIGIAAEDLQRIFQPFQQGEATYRRQAGGTGLGLAISRELCLALGGDLRCESVMGEGSTFRVSLPLPLTRPASVRARRLAPRGDAARDAGWTPHVLLVDDNPVNTLVAEAELQQLGVRVTVCHAGADALAWLSHGQADLVLMDLDMPVMDGFEATRRIREQEAEQGRAAVPIVALTANGPEVCAVPCGAAGMDDHLLKPFHSEDMARMLRKHLPAWQGPREDGAAPALMATRTSGPA